MKGMMAKVWKIRIGGVNQNQDVAAAVVVTVAAVIVEVTTGVETLIAVYQVVSHHSDALLH
jgi:hypothetical protein